MTRTRLASQTANEGLISVVVLLGLVVLMLMSGVILKQGAARRDQVRAQARRLQAESLAESGLRRARAKLAINPNYRGETWTIPVEVLGKASGASGSGESDAIVAILVEPWNKDKKVRDVHVRADYPRDPQLRARLSRRALVEVESPTKATGGTNE